MSAAPKLWVILGRPVRLPNALIAVQALRESFPGGCHLLRDESQWWDRANWQLYARYFTDIHAFPRVRTCRGLVDLPRLYRETAGRKSAVAQLPINADRDVLLCLASVMGLANAAVSAHPNVYKILCISKSGYEGLTRHPDRMRFRFTTSGWLQNRVIEPLAGVERTINFKPRLNPGGDGVRLVRLQKEPQQVYDSVVCMSNTGRELPVHADARLIAARCPSMAELPELPAFSGEASGRRRVLLFGTPFLLIHNLEPDVYIQHLNQCLDFLRRSYPNADLIYRPHPIETKEASRLQLERFRIEDDREAAELYFMRHFAEIEAVYSVSSTVSRTAFNYGLNAYSLWRCFPFTDTAAKFFERLMGEVPHEFDIRDLNQPPAAYQDSRVIEQGTRSFGEALKVALETKALKTA
jgi:hypothetical protein